MLGRPPSAYEGDETFLDAVLEDDELISGPRGSVNPYIEGPRRKINWPFERLELTEQLYRCLEAVLNGIEDEDEAAEWLRVTLRSVPVGADVRQVLSPFLRVLVLENVVPNLRLRDAHDEAELVEEALERLPAAAPELLEVSLRLRDSQDVESAWAVESAWYAVEAHQPFSPSHYVVVSLLRAYESRWEDAASATDAAALIFWRRVGQSLLRTIEAAYPEHQ
jgi:hypothetical protein